MAIFGTIQPPPQIAAYGPSYTSLMKIASNVVQFIVVLGGIWAFVNLILAGFTYIQSGDNPDNLARAHQKIYMSVIGLVLMVGSFVLAAILGYLLYKDPTAILNPKIYGP